MFSIKVNSEDFEKIKSGIKTQECMINTGDDIFVGDHILFKKKPELFDGVLTKVIDKKIFTSFNEMATVLSLDDLGFGGCNKEQVVEICEKTFDKTLAEKHGVVVFKFELVD